MLTDFQRSFSVHTHRKIREKSWNTFFGLVNYYRNKLLLQYNQTFLPWHFGLYQKPSSEEACSVLLPVLARVEMWRGKKLVVHVAALIPAQGPLILETGRGQPQAEPHVWPISCHVTSSWWQELEEELNKLLLVKVSGKDQNIKVEMFGCVEVMVFCHAKVIIKDPIRP